MGKPVCVVRNSKFCIDVLVDYSNRARSLFTIPIEDSIKRRELVTLNLYLFIKSYIILKILFLFQYLYFTATSGLKYLDMLLIKNYLFAM